MKARLVLYMHSLEKEWLLFRKTGRNVLDFRRELDGLYHPIAVGLVELMDSLTHNLYYETRPTFLVEMRRDMRESGGLIAQIVFDDADIRLFLTAFRTGCTHLSRKNWSRDNCNLAYSLEDPTISIEKIADMFSYMVMSQEDL